MKKRSILIVMIISLLLVSGLVSAGFFDQLFGKKLTVKQSEQIAVEKKSNIEAKETISKKTDGYAENSSLNIKIFYKTIQAPRKPTLYGDFGEEALNFLRIQGTYDNFIVNAKKGAGNNSNKLELELKSMLANHQNTSILSRWKTEDNRLKSLGDYLVTEENEELQVKDNELLIGNGITNANINLASRAVVINPRQMSSSDRVRMNIPQDVVFEFNNCEDLADSDVAGSCEKVIHISSNMSVEGFALMGGDVVRFTSDVWILVEGANSEPQEPAVGCKDSDSGSDIFKKGTCVDITSKLNEDYCLKTGELKEWSCNNNLCLSNLTICPKDFSCYKGECIKNQEPLKQSWFLKIMGRFLG